MFNLSGSELIFLLLIALVVLGPEKLPEAVRKFGKVYGEVKKMSSGFQSELKSALDEPLREMRETAEAFKKAASFNFDEGYYETPTIPDADTVPDAEAAAEPAAAADANAAAEPAAAADAVEPETVGTVDEPVPAVAVDGATDAPTVTPAAAPTPHVAEAVEETASE